MGTGEQYCGGGYHSGQAPGEFAHISLEELRRRAEADARGDLSHVQPAEAQPTFSQEDRILVSVDRLERHQLPNGSFTPEFLQGNLQNLTTELQERGMPYAVSRTFHEVSYRMTPEGRRQRTFLWRLGKVAVQNSIEVAESGRKFHQAEAALARVDIEEEEAPHNDMALSPGRALAFISPRMSDKDAPREVAKKEHLADDDAIRVTYAVTNDKNEVIGRRMESILVPDVPLSAWVDMLRSPNNIFGKSIPVEDDGSALSVMKVFRELELPEDKLSEGVLSILEGVTPYIDDLKIRHKIQNHLESFRLSDQETLEKQARRIAERQQHFDIEILKSRKHGRATPVVEQFVFSLQNEWGDEALEIIQSHDLPDGGLRMSRKLEALLVGSKQNILMTRAGVLSGNTKILDQMSAEACIKVYEAEDRMQDMQRRGIAAAQLAGHEIASNQLIARQNVKGGSGCSSEAKSGFGGKKKGGDDTSSNSESKRFDDFGNEIEEETAKEETRWSKGVCRVQACTTRPGITDVGECSVCRHCQSLYEKGIDPSKFVNSRKGLGLAALFGYKKEEFGLAS